ncbi:hypothetical protein HYFRA_00001755 [Hymenoscyphus fraxineus]|uniref:Chromosome segregation in meiosis protein n=1 Tax=Hymenoscyphus fraxineus TaxID=746836 RepID=A0A9N9L4F6_9HELO|nr:hypothetical protein HYFRA_00001755 [Hymenoscyphus fraxineus]
MTSPRPLPTDDLDDLFDYEGGADDPFSPNYVSEVARKAKEDNAAKEKSSAAGLGIDEEIEVTRKPRAPRVKLDEHRLLSAAGIPKLRKKAKNHLKFKGKGHEFSDATRLLQFYQLWLDDLFPKARFLDALAMVEKMGHKKMMQSARVEWINEGKPRSSVHEDSIFDEPELPAGEKDVREKTPQRTAPIFEKTLTERPKTPSGSNLDDLFDDDDLYDATPKPVRANPTDSGSQSNTAEGSKSIFGPRKETAPDDEVPDDDLDALLAEEEMMQNSKPAAPVARPAEPDFADEMEIMDEMGW